MTWRFADPAYSGWQASNAALSTHGVYANAASTSRPQKPTRSPGPGALAEGTAAGGSVANGPSGLERASCGGRPCILV